MEFFFNRLSLDLKYYLVKIIEKLFNPRIARRIEPVIVKYSKIILFILLLMIFSVLLRKNYSFIHNFVENNQEYQQLNSGILNLYVLMLFYLFFTLIVLYKKDKVQEDYYYQIYPNKQEFSQLWVNWYILLAVSIYLTFMLPLAIIVILLNGVIEILYTFLLTGIFIFYISSHIRIVLFFSKLSLMKFLTNIRLRIYGLVNFITYIVFLMFLPLNNYFNHLIYAVMLVTVMLLQILKHLNIKKLTKDSNLLAYEPNIKNHYKLLDENDNIAINVKDLRFAYKDKDILGKINIELKPGKIYTVLGKNGSGKTTLFKCLNNINNSYTGSINIKNNLMIPAGKEFKFKCTLQDFINSLNILGAKNKKRDIDELIVKFNLQDRLTDYIDDFSLGMKNKIIFLGSYLFDIEIYLIDEPFITFDPISMKTTLNIMNDIINENRTIIISTHLLHTAFMISETLLILNNNSIKLFDNKFKDYNQFEEKVIREMT